MFEKTWQATWFDIDNLNDIPPSHFPFNQVYAVAICEGTREAVIVTYDNSKDNLSGGIIEAGESFEQTLRRELNEEINATVIDWKPLGYQQVKPTDGSSPPAYQLRVLAIVSIHTRFVRGHDSGGSVTGNKTVPLEELAITIGHGATGEHLQQRAMKLLDSLDAS